MKSGPGSGLKSPAWRRLRADRGSVSVLTIYIVLLAGSLATFLYDASYELRAANKADTYSAEAARAAATAVGPVPTGGSTDAALASNAARSYLAAAGVTDFHVTILGPATIQVQVTVTGHTPLLNLPIHQTRTHTAQLQVGVDHGEDVP